MSLKETVMKYYDKSMNYSCSESMLHGLNEYYGLNLSEDLLKACGAHSRGMYGGFACGALVSCADVLALKYSNGHAHDSKEMQEMIMKFNRIVKEDLSSGQCGELRAKYYAPDLRCSLIVARIAELFEQFMNEVNV